MVEDRRKGAGKEESGFKGKDRGRRREIIVS